MIPLSVRLQVSCKMTPCLRFHVGVGSTVLACRSIEVCVTILPCSSLRQSLPLTFSCLLRVPTQPYSLCPPITMQVTAYTGFEELGAALKDADLVVIPAGVPRKPGMTRDDLFNTNAGIVRDLIVAVAKHAPNVRHAVAASLVG